MTTKGGGGDGALWQILDVGSIWMREFASAMAMQVETVAWWPEMLPFAALGRERAETIAAPPLTVRRFPLQRVGTWEERARALRLAVTG